MQINKLISNIQQLSNSFQQSAISAVNVHLTIRNWLIGFYIVEFEQQGEDRAKYGEKLLQNLAEKLNEEGFSYRNLKLFRQFYVTYPQVADYLPVFFQRNVQIWHSLSAKLQLPENKDIAIGQSVIAKSEKTDIAIWQTPSAQLQLSENKGIAIGHSLSAQFENINIPLIPVEKFITKLSFTHIKQLLPIENPLKRLFYEIECIKGTWSVRELKRQIDTLFYERSGMSEKPELLNQIVQEKTEKLLPANVIKTTSFFEFLGVKSKDVVYESDLEKALIEHLQEFILELGDGFCFEAQQKRILIGDEYFYCDLVFYHRILKCHVLVELKIGQFEYEHIGQLKTYINYYRKEIMRQDDNPPVGILLVTDKNNALIEYAFADSDKDIFVSKYALELPTKQQLADFILNEYKKL